MSLSILYSRFSVVFLSPSVCVAPKLRSLHFAHPVYVASRYFQENPPFSLPLATFSLGNSRWQQPLATREHFRTPRLCHQYSHKHDPHCYNHVASRYLNTNTRSPPLPASLSLFKEVLPSELGCSVGCEQPRAHHARGGPIRGIRASRRRKLGRGSVPPELALIRVPRKIRMEHAGLRVAGQRRRTRMFRKCRGEP